MNTNDNKWFPATWLLPKASEEFNRCFTPKQVEKKSSYDCFWSNHFNSETGEVLSVSHKDDDLCDSPTNVSGIQIIGEGKIQVFPIVLGFRPGYGTDTFYGTKEDIEDYGG